MGPPRLVPCQIDFVGHHALREQSVERLNRFLRQVAGHVHGAREEARVQQVQDGMLDSADVLVDVHPVIRLLPNRWRICPRRGEPDEIPGAVHERVHRVRFPQGRPAAGGTRAAAPLAVPLQRIPGNAEIRLFGQHDRQVLLFFGNGAAILAVHDRDRTAPIPLPAYSPVAKTVFRRSAADSGRFAACDRRGNRVVACLDFAPCHRADVADRLFLRRNEGHIRHRRSVFDRFEHINDVQAVFAREFEGRGDRARDSRRSLPFRNP